MYCTKAQPEVDMMQNKSMNHRINMLYRQLGKSVFDSDKAAKYLTLNQKRLIKEIERNIAILEQTEKETETNPLPDSAKILEPTQNEQGLFVYRFCKNCHVGNNPESTHCSQCHEAL